MASHDRTVFAEKCIAFSLRSVFALMCLVVLALFPALTCLEAFAVLVAFACLPDLEVLLFTCGLAAAAWRVVALWFDRLELAPSISTQRWRALGVGGIGGAGGSLSACAARRRALLAPAGRRHAARPPR